RAAAKGHKPSNRERADRGQGGGDSVKGNSQPGGVEARVARPDQIDLIAEAARAAARAAKVVEVVETPEVPEPVKASALAEALESQLISRR
ncbi:hypothetical protein LCGC14_2401280, partial [marine sediment metagenome]